MTDWTLSQRGYRFVKDGKITGAIDAGDFPGHPFRGNQYSGQGKMQGENETERIGRENQRNASTENLKYGIREGGRSSLNKYHADPGVANAVREYGNNRGSQKAVKEALRQAGASESEISKIDWRKSYFAQREFEA